MVAACGLFFLVAAGVGTASGEILSLGRGLHFIALSDNPVAFYVTFTIDVVLGLLVFGVGCFMWWGNKLSRSSEQRFFQRRALLEPERD